MPIKGKKNTLWLKHSRKPEKLTNLIERLKLESDLKFSISGDASTILFTDEKDIYSDHTEIPENRQLYATAATKKKDVTIKRLHT